MNILSRLFTKNPLKKTATALFADIVAQSRVPYFYAELDVPDTVEGRYDMICLHMSLLLRRLRQEGEVAKPLAQAVFDVMFKNMDYSLREMGVGDLRVGKKVRGLAEEFYGRLGAYNEAFEKGDIQNLQAVTARNVYARPDENFDHMPSKKLAEYALASASLLENQSLERFNSGLVEFPDPVKL